LNFENLQFLSRGFDEMPFCFLMQNCAEIGQPFIELWPKTAIFQDGGRRHLEY